MTVKEQIQSLKMTQKKFADVCGCSLRSVQYWVQKDKMPKLAHTILKLLKNQQDN